MGSSIEQVLHGLARSLLVSSENYARVAGYVDRRDWSMRMGTDNVWCTCAWAAARKRRLLRKPRGECLAEKLEFREHPLTPWVKAEIDHKFNYLACDTVEQFQRASGRSHDPQSPFQERALAA